MSQAAKDPGPWETLARRHQTWGWRLLLIFVAAGLALETMHGLKAGFYLDPKNNVRRELWTLAHAHGTLVAVVQLLFSAAITGGWWNSWARAKLCSHLLFAAAIFLPGGFFLGGFGHSEGDPGIGVWWVPVGGLFLVGAVLLAAAEIGRSNHKREDANTETPS